MENGSSTIEKGKTKVQFRTARGMYPQMVDAAVLSTPEIRAMYSSESAV